MPSRRDQVPPNLPLATCLSALLFQQEKKEKASELRTLSGRPIEAPSNGRDACGRKPMRAKRNLTSAEESLRSDLTRLTCLHQPYPLSRAPFRNGSKGEQGCSCIHAIGKLLARIRRHILFCSETWLLDEESWMSESEHSTVQRSTVQYCARLLLPLPDVDWWHSSRQEESYRKAGKAIYPHLCLQLREIGGLRPNFIIDHNHMEKNLFNVLRRNLSIVECSA